MAPWGPAGGHAGLHRLRGCICPAQVRCTPAQLAMLLWAAQLKPWSYTMHEHQQCIACCSCPSFLSALTGALAAAGAPEHLEVIMEGESLFNDASSIVLFQIFFEMVGDLFVCMRLLCTAATCPDQAAHSILMHALCHR